MCFTPQASIIAFSLNLIGCFTLSLSPRDDLRQLGKFFFFVGLMQIWDFIFWHTQTAKRASINKVTTRVAILSNHLQPIVLWYLFRDRVGHKTRALLGVYCIVSLIYTIMSFKSVKRTMAYPCGSDAEGSPCRRKSLHWSWNHLEKYTGASLVMYGSFHALMHAVAISALPRSLALLMLFIQYGTFAMGGLVKKEDIGRFWCFFAALIPIFLAVGDRMLGMEKKKSDE